MLDLFLHSTEATELLGVQFSKVLTPGCVIYLYGELGTGKTTLARGLLRGFGYLGIVKSPTFNLLETYQLREWQLFHWDLYRLEDPEELEYLGLRDQLDGEAIILVEWPERGEGKLPAADIKLTLSYCGEHRNCQLEGCSLTGIGIVALLSN
jgi:tRNA threonylcarbamoyladenosine biosynthesis protein TsaE